MADLPLRSMNGGTDPIEKTLREADEQVEKILQNPAKPFDTKSLEESTLLLGSTNLTQSPLWQPLLLKIWQALQVVQHEPGPLVNLLLSLPFTFSHVTAIVQAEHLVAGLNPEAAQYNLLTLALLERATAQAEAEAVAGMSGVLQALVDLWLRTSNIGVATKACDVLYNLLRVDIDLAPTLSSTSESMPSIASYGTGHVWKRIFGDAGVYENFYYICSLNKGTKDLSSRRKSLSQARLLEWLPRVASLHWSSIASPQHPDVEKKYDAASGGLLEFAALRMIDVDDILVRVQLINFYTDLLRIVRQTSTTTQHTSLSLDFCINTGIHAQMLQFFTNPETHDTMELMLLHGPCANYAATYAFTYPDHLEGSSDLASIHDRIRTTLKSTTPARWAHAESPKHELHVLASLPRTSLTSPQGDFESSLVSLLSTKVTNADALNTLATIFHGPPSFDPLTGLDVIHTPHTAERQRKECAAAKAITVTYARQRPAMWIDLISHAETLAMKDIALSSLNVLRAIVTANWTFPPGDTAAGSEALQTFDMPILSTLVPYLLKPAMTFAQVGEDRESAAFQVATSKFELTRKLAHVCGQREEQQWVQTAAQLRGRLSQGLFGGGVGGRQVDTMGS